MRYTLKKLQEEDDKLYSRLRQYCYAINGCCQLVHDELGPFLNEYIYQDALAIVLGEKSITYQKEYYFSINFHGQSIHHKHYVDFYVDNKSFIECKAVETIAPEHRQQLWNYMRLTKTRIGILWNFAPVHDQSEHYYYDPTTEIMYMY